MSRIFTKVNVIVGLTNQGNSDMETKWTGCYAKIRKLSPGDCEIVQCSN